MIKYTDIRPGEVWICSEPTFKNKHDIQEQIPHGVEPFIITYVSRERVGFVQASDFHEPFTGSFWFGVEWEWHEHMTRLWPEAPSWQELGRDPSEFSASKP